MSSNDPAAGGPGGGTGRVPDGVGPDGAAGGPALTWEARWFFPGDPPAAVVRALFPDAGEKGNRDRDVDEGAATGFGEAGDGWSVPRTDRYLVFSAEMGIKLRDEPDRPALLEFKGRLAPAEETRFGSAGVGLADRWAKWSLPAAGVPAELRAAVHHGTRVCFVTKTRLLTLLELGGQGEPRTVAPGVRVDRGVQLELSRIRVDRNGPPGSGSPLARAWSLSFEAFPLTPELPGRVRPAVTPWLERAGAAGVTLDRDHSAAYPGWLLGLT